MNRHCRLWIVAAAGLVAASIGGETIGDDRFSATARRAGLRVVEGAHLALATDVPLRERDGVDELPTVFDAAFDAWCRHYGIDPAEHADWRAKGCLVVDRERFRAAGLLGDDIPDFANGYCDRDRFWLMEPSNPAYRRHLLLHEGVHAFTITLRSLDAPAWYTEGIAELLATHRLEAGRFVPTPIPRAASDVEQLGRIERLRSSLDEGRPPALADVLAAATSPHGSIDTYAGNWAAVAMLSRHPAYADAFATLEQGPLDRSLTDRLRRLPGFDAARASRDFAAFLDELDYGFDFDRSAIDWRAGPPLEDARTVSVAADRGWQNAGVSLVAGGRFTLRATGRCRLGSLPTRSIESGAEGISLDWHRGRPVGRLLVAQWVEAGRGRAASRFEVIAEGGAAEFTAVVDGPLYLKINEPPVGLADNAGSLSVELAPERAAR